MGKYIRVTCILSALLFLSPAVFCQEIETRTIPNVLLRPERGEAPRYPKDLVIGELGKGEAPEEAYKLARQITGDLLSAPAVGADGTPVSTGTLSLFSEFIIEKIRDIEPRTYRLGGGKTETDGSVSFLLRFFGLEQSITGELFLRQKEQKLSEEAGMDEEAGTVEAKKAIWYLDDLILEEKRALSDLRDSYRYDFSPYERFF